LYSGVPTVATGTVKGFRIDTRNSTVSIPTIATLSTPYLAHYWYPCKDGPTDKANSVWVDITIPEGSYNGYDLMAVSNGLLVETTSSGGKKTFKWRHNYPIVPYYVMVAVSNYRTINDTYSANGHNFPLTYYVFPEDYTAGQFNSRKFFGCL
jgi:aminopeptidase N